MIKIMPLFFVKWHFFVLLQTEMTIFRLHLIYTQLKSKIAEVQSLCTIDLS